MMTPKTSLRDSVLILGIVSAVCLLNVGLARSWLMASAMVIVALVRPGYWWAVARIQRKRAALDAEWRALDRSCRMRETFFDAERAMRQEALLYRPDKPSQTGHVMTTPTEDFLAPKNVVGNTPHIGEVDVTNISDSQK